MIGDIVFFCVHYCSKVVTRKKELLNLLYSYWNQAQALLKQHVNVISDIHSESMKNYSNILNEMAGRVIPVNIQVLQTSKQTKKNNRILLSIINLLKSDERMGIPLRGQRDDSQYQPGHPCWDC